MTESAHSSRLEVFYFVTISEKTYAFQVAKKVSVYHWPMQQAPYTFIFSVTNDKSCTCRYQKTIYTTYKTG